MALVDDLVISGYLRTPRIIDAFRKVKRADFLPPEMRDLADLNEALPIGHGQTISQPMVVAFMLELLNPKPGDKILDIGSGSGWTTALLAHIVSQNNADGKIYAIETIPGLKEFGQSNADKYDFVKKGIAKFVLADGSLGLEKEAPFDKILASASAQKIPEAWKKQLAIGGTLVAPVKESIWKMERESDTIFKTSEYHGFVFVPLVTRKTE